MFEGTYWTEIGCQFDIQSSYIKYVKLTRARVLGALHKIEVQRKSEKVSLCDERYTIVLVLCKKTIEQHYIKMRRSIRLD